MGLNRLNGPGQFLTKRKVSPDNSNDLPNGICSGLYVGGSGDLYVLCEGDPSDQTTDTAPMVGVPAGSFIPGHIRRVLTATSCTNIVALY